MLGVIGKGIGKGIATFRGMAPRAGRGLAVVLFALALLGATFAGSQAWAQEITLDRSIIVKELRDRHAEAPVGFGLASNGGVIELFATEDGATWTMVPTMPGGESFVIGAGKDWSILAIPVKGRKI